MIIQNIIIVNMFRTCPITIEIPMRMSTERDTNCNLASSPFYATFTYNLFYVISFYQAFNIKIVHFITVTGIY